MIRAGVRSTRPAWVAVKSAAVFTFLVCGACGGGSSSSTATSSTATPSTIAVAGVNPEVLEEGATTGTTANPGPASSVDLAPSQVSASTVVPPQLPDACDPADIAVASGESVPDADQVIVVTNSGSRSCDVDIRDSPAADEDLEPSVLLEPGGAAQVWISENPDCQDADNATQIELRINGESRVVPLVFTPVCGVELWAFFTTDDCALH